MTDLTTTCSFCGKMGAEVQQMVGATSSDAIICNECIKLAVSVLPQPAMTDLKTVIRDALNDDANRRSGSADVFLMDVEGDRDELWIDGNMSVDADRLATAVRDHFSYKGMWVTTTDEGRCLAIFATEEEAEAYAEIMGNSTVEWLPVTRVEGLAAGGSEG